MGAGLCLIAFVVVSVVTRDPQSSAGKSFGPAAVLVGFVAVIFGSVWLLSRRGRARPARHLRVDVDGRDRARGDDVLATLTVAGGTVVAGQLQLGLVCIERYDEERGGGTRNVAYRATTENAVAEQWVPVEAGAAASRTFTIPDDGIPSYEGECLSYAWRVSAREVRPNERDRRTDAPIWVRR